MLCATKTHLAKELFHDTSSTSHDRDASRGFGVESGRFHAEGDQTFTVLERWAFLANMPEYRGLFDETISQRGR